MRGGRWDLKFRDAMLCVLWLASKLKRAGETSGRLKSERADKSEVARIDFHKPLLSRCESESEM